MQYSTEEERVFVNYVRQFSKKYKVQKGDDGIWEIVCKKGDIEPYSLTELCCYQKFPNRVGIYALKNRLPKYCTVTQETGGEIVFKFPKEHLDEIADLVKAKKRRKISEEQRLLCAERLKSYREKNLQKNGGF